MEDISEDIYELYINKIEEPPSYKTVWQLPNGNRLGIVLLEFREQKFIKQLIKQIAHVYGGSDVSLFIVHSIKNETFFKKILQNWKNVTYIKLSFDDNDTLSNYEKSQKYSDICCDPTLYSQLNTQFVLFIQWDAFIRKRIPEHFFKFSYVGAPWVGFPNDWPDNPNVQLGNKRVGNGGFSLRNVKRMIEICSEHTRGKLNEDVFISNHLDIHELPSIEEAKSFSVEWIYHPDPVGCHAIWKFHPIEDFTKLLQF